MKVYGYKYHNFDDSSCNFTETSLWQNQAAAREAMEALATELAAELDDTCGASWRWEGDTILLSSHGEDQENIELLEFELK